MQLTTIQANMLKFKESRESLLQRKFFCFSPCFAHHAFSLVIPYLFVYNAHLCIIHTPIFRLHFKKGKKKGSKEAENRGCHFTKLALKIMFWTHLKKMDAIDSFGG